MILNLQVCRIGICGKQGRDSSSKAEHPLRQVSPASPQTDFCSIVCFTVQIHGRICLKKLLFPKPRHLKMQTWPPRKVCLHCGSPDLPSP